jgi:hypothetical protein
MEALTLAASRQDYEQLARAVVMKALDSVPSPEPLLSPTPRSVN